MKFFAERKDEARMEPPCYMPWYSAGDPRQAKHKRKFCCSLLLRPSSARARGRLAIVCVGSLESRDLRVQSQGGAYMAMPCNIACRGMEGNEFR